eukprot:3090924-Pyramimonas_sp.AAC.1
MATTKGRKMATVPSRPRLPPLTRRSHKEMRKPQLRQPTSPTCRKCCRRRGPGGGRMSSRRV